MRMQSDGLIEVSKKRILIRDKKAVELLYD